MCEANVYLLKDDQEQLVMKSVDIVEPRDSDTWRLVDIFGDQKHIKARIRIMNLVNHKIIFEPIDD